MRWMMSTAHGNHSIMFVLMLRMGRGEKMKISEHLCSPCMTSGILSQLCEGAFVLFLH